MLSFVLEMFTRVYEFCGSLVFVQDIKEGKRTRPQYDTHIRTHNGSLVLAAVGQLSDTYSDRCTHE